MTSEKGRNFVGRKKIHFLKLFVSHLTYLDELELLGRDLANCQRLFQGGGGRRFKVVVGVAVREEVDEDGGGCGVEWGRDKDDDGINF